MNSLLELILKIEKRPELWIGSNKTNDLWLFLSGYSLAKEKESVCWLKDDFMLYLIVKYNGSWSMNWSALIEEHESDGDSTDAFFRLLHEYLKENPIPESYDELQLRISEKNKILVDNVMDTIKKK